MPLDAAVDKVVVTHGGALRAKYGAAGLSTIRAALRTSIGRDRGRGITTAVVDLSRRAAVAPVGQQPVADPGDHERVRAVVDALCELTAPDYLLLLGGPDVVPVVPLRNPMPAPDPDPDVPSNLPYACPGSAGLDAGTLVGPTRVVGRLPDVPGASGEPAAREFAALIRRSARWAAVAPDRHRDPFCVSTARWQLATSATLAALRGDPPGAPAPALSAAPPAAAPWPPAELAKPLHLVNLHGASADPSWLGDPGFAPALSSGDLPGALGAGTVVLAECCFAAELWDPALAGALPIPLAYLAAGAYGLVGPTCISYGGRATPDVADVLVRMVGQELLAGASLGRALLTARQRYVADQPVMTPVDLKTLAQFDLLGDPSIQPVSAPVPTTRAARRSALTAAGGRLARSTPVAVPVGAPASADTIRSARAVSGARIGPLQTFDVVAPTPAVRAGLGEIRIHLAARRRPGPRAAAQLQVVEFREDAAGLREHRRLESRSRG